MCGDQCSDVSRSATRISVQLGKREKMAKRKEPITNGGEGCQPVGGMQLAALTSVPLANTPHQCLPITLSRIAALGIIDLPNTAYYPVQTVSVGTNIKFGQHKHYEENQHVQYL